MNKIREEPNHASERWTLARDIGVLQVKLIIDGLRDLLLVPASLAVGLVSLFSNQGGRPGSQFYHLLGVGKQSERWINLFGALENAPADTKHVEPFPDADIDDLVGRFESFVVDEHKRGGITAQAKQRMDKAIDKIRRSRGATGGESLDP